MAGEPRLLSCADIPVVNVGTFMVDRMKSFGDRIALVNGETGNRYTYRQLVQRVERAAAGLQKIGVAKGDVICIVSPNHMDYFAACYATFLVSAIFQPVNPTYTKGDIAKAAKACNTRFVITTVELYHKVRDAVADVGAVKIIVFGKCVGCISFDYLLHPSHGSYRTPEVDPKTTEALLMSSSGTTGFPKAVRISHHNVIAQALQISVNRNIRPRDTCLVYLPLFHVYGLCIVSVPCLYNGGTVVVSPKISVDGYLRLIEKYKPRVLNVVPPVLVTLAKRQRLSEYDLSSVKDIACGAAPLSPKIEDTITRRFGINYLSQGYGMTETIQTHANTESSFRPGSVGKTLPLVETKIVDVGTGKTLGPNEEGEIWIRGPQASLGYLNMPVETERMFLKDGWVRTGDIGKLDKDGYLYVVDRIKELIKYKGFQVAPAVLEDILIRHGKVADVGVVGVPDEEAGELPKAYVVKRVGSEVTADELVKYVADKVPVHMKLRGGVEFVDSIPKSPSGKILRRTLRQRANVVPSRM